MNHIYTTKFKNFVFLVILILFSSCTEEVVNTLTYPTTFTFNTPLLESRSVHKIDTFSTWTGTDWKLNWKFEELTEELGAFNRSNSLISDTLNQMIRDSFADLAEIYNFPLRVKKGSMITSITLLSGNEMKISYGRLDTIDSKNPLLDKIYNTIDTTFNYKAEGNFIIPGLYLNNDSRELYLCNEFIYASKRGTKSPREYQYLRRLSNGPDRDASLNRLVNKYGPLKYDTVSIEYVNFIFSSYK